MIAWLLACGGGPELVTPSLPDGRLGERYAFALEARGRRLAWSAAGLPEGLTLHPERGLVSGVPRSGGDFVVDVQVTDRGGETAARSLALTVSGAARGCGLILTGELTEMGFDDVGAVDSTREGGSAVVPLPIPAPDIHRVDLEPAGAVALYLVEPGRRLTPDQPLDAQAERLEPRDETEPTLALGWNTIPNLGAHQVVGADPELVVVAEAPGPWEVTTTCVPGPIVERDTVGPFRRGDRVLAGFAPTKPGLGATLEALDPLPPDLELQPNGLLLGAAEEAGAWPFRLRATTADGASVDTVVTVHVHDPVRPACGQTVPIASAAAGTDLTDVQQFVSLEADWADHVALTWTLDVTDTARVFVVPPEHPLVGASDAEPEGRGGPQVVEMAPDSWPVAAHFQRSPQARVLVADAGGPVEGTVTLACDDGPRLDAAGLPVLDPGRRLSVPLHTVGGAGPWTWTAEGLPASVTLEDGRLVSDGTDFGEAEVTLTVTDAAGGSRTTTRPLYASTGLACGPGVQVLRCGDEVDDAEGRICLEANDVTDADWVVVGFRGEVPAEVTGRPPNRWEGPDALVPRRTLRLTRGDGVPLLDLDAYDGLPYRLEARSDATNPVCVRCGVGPVPDMPLDDCDP